MKVLNNLFVLLIVFFSYHVEAMDLSGELTCGEPKSVPHDTVQNACEAVVPREETAVILNLPHADQQIAGEFFNSFPLEMWHLIMEHLPEDSSFRFLAFYCGTTPTKVRKIALLLVLKACENSKTFKDWLENVSRLNTCATFRSGLHNAIRDEIGEIIQAFLERCCSHEMYLQSHASTRQRILAKELYPIFTDSPLFKKLSPATRDFITMLPRNMWIAGNIRHMGKDAADYINSLQHYSITDRDMANGSLSMVRFARVKSTDDLVANLRHLSYDELQELKRFMIIRHLLMKHLVERIDCFIDSSMANGVFLLRINEVSMCLASASALYKWYCVYDRSKSFIANFKLNWAFNFRNTPIWQRYGFGGYLTVWGPGLIYGFVKGLLQSQYTLREARLVGLFNFLNRKFDEEAKMLMQNISDELESRKWQSIGSSFKP